MAFDSEEVLKQFGIPPLPQHHFVISPNEGVGPVLFGMHKDEVSHLFTYAYTSFFKNLEDRVRSDTCDLVGLTIHYTDEGAVRRIEVTLLPLPRVSVELFGTNLAGITVRDAVGLLRSKSAVVSKNSYGYEFPELGIATFCSHFESEDDLVEWLTVDPIPTRA
jgi:hypothetical protein